MIDLVDGLFLLGLFGFTSYCVLDVALSQRDQVRTLPRSAWLAMVVFVPLLGGVAWMAAGRPTAAGLRPGSLRSPDHPGFREATVPLPTGGTGRAPAEPSTPGHGPEDDPAFIRHLEDLVRRQREGR